MKLIPTNGLASSSDLDISPSSCQRLQVSFVHALSVGHDQVLAPAGQQGGTDSHAQGVPEHDGGGKRSASHPWRSWSCASELLAAEGTRDVCWIRSQAKGWGVMRTSHA